MNVIEYSLVHFLCSMFQARKGVGLIDAHALSALVTCTGGKDGFQKSPSLRVQGGGQNGHRCLLQGDTGHESQY